MFEFYKKIIAFIGLSSPTAYYYDFKNEYSKDNQWNLIPIIESPQGLMTLFDEIWFLHPALCPITMRKLDFVKFIVDDSKLLKLSKNVIEQIHQKSLIEVKNDITFLDSAVDLNFHADFPHYNKIINGVFGVYPNRKMPIDNHSHQFNFVTIAI